MVLKSLGTNEVLRIWDKYQVLVCLLDSSSPLPSIPSPLLLTLDLLFQSFIGHQPFVLSSLLTLSHSLSLNASQGQRTGCSSSHILKTSGRSQTPSYPNIPYSHLYPMHCTLRIPAWLPPLRIPDNVSSTPGSLDLSLNLLHFST